MEGVFAKAGNTLVFYCLLSRAALNSFALTYMRIELHGTVHLQQRQIILKGSRIILAMHNDALDILSHWTLALQIPRDIELAHDSDQAGQEAAKEGVRLIRD